MEDQDEVLGRVPSDLQENFEDDEDLTEELHPDLSKLQQERSFVCPEDPPEEVHGLILYQTEPSAGSSLDADVFMSNDADEFVERKASPGSSGETSADQVDEISEGCLDPVEPAADDMEEKFHNIYSYAEPSFSSVLDQSKCAETTREGGRTGTEVSTSRDGADHLLDPSQIKTDDSEPLDLKFSVQPSGGGKTPEQLLVPVKIEEPKPEPGEDVCPDSSEVKHSCFLSYPVKSEDSETKAEPFEFPVRAQSLQVKPEDLTLHMKSENFGTKPVALRFVAYSDGKADVKPPDLRFPVGSDEFKTESKPKGLRFPSLPEAKTEVLRFTAYPDSSEVKAEAKPEDLEFSALPEVKAELKQEMLEADSTVLTPKLEQADGMVDPSGSLVLKGQVKEEKPSTPGYCTHVTSKLL